MLKVGHLAVNAKKKETPAWSSHCHVRMKRFRCLIKAFSSRLVSSRLAPVPSSSSSPRRRTESRNSETSLLFETRAASARKKKRGLASPRCFLAGFIWGQFRPTREKDTMRIDSSLSSPSTRSPRRHCYFPGEIASLRSINAEIASSGDLGRNRLKW